MSQTDPAEVVAAPQTASTQVDELTRRHRNGANWFYWIAGLSLVNSIVLLVGGGFAFVVGLGITQLVDIIAMEVARAIMEDGVSSPQTPTAIVTGIKLAAFAFDVVVAAVVVLFGWLANKRYGWAFILGMVLYLLDGLLFLLIGDFLSAGFHAFALYGLLMGYTALKPLREAEALAAAEPPVPAAPPMDAIADPAPTAAAEPSFSPEDNDQLCEGFLDQPDCREVLDWLQSVESGQAELGFTLGERDADDSLLLAQSLYGAGATRVCAVEIDEEPGGQNTGKLVIELPAEPGARQQLFLAVQSIIAPVGYDVPPDQGQRYLFMMLD
ncbi:MAG: hypothetical protein GY851_13905 [bacterium]|nr:hypothetical protein [bacterium]